MGTSASSRGPKDKNPLVPPWAEGGDGLTISPATNTDGNVNVSDGGGQEVDNNAVQQEIGPSGQAQPPASRYKSARQAFGKYAGTGGTSSDLRRSLKHYSKNSSGGGKGTSRRLASGITAGAGLVGMMRGDSVTVGEQSLSLNDLRGLTTDQAIDRIASHLAPDNSDSDAVRIALNYALEEALPDTQDFDPASFTDEVIQEAISCYLTDLIFQDVVTGMGEAWFKAEVATRHHKMEIELRELIKVITQQEMDKATNGNPSNITKNNIKKIQIEAISKTVDHWEKFND
ncbi:hypothetical protein GVO02_06820 [Aeromonas caviae]|jgi:hypothetical protein|uniref:Uncharacterized protein n=1 Tax=Aeromonas caviae TaxID=648 RepID=A0A6S4SZX6_AERCA|nr:MULTISPECIES: hypothetical protein [Aeromonas]MBL0510914.1 hypothetical protein [Aeromonas caviae]MCE9861568.1 hypothetical protein [Aeromonas caviae]MDU4188242.1 hypothetical protein [Aeromonas sp.]NBA29963.1 hypothetical protein [Aeromonas caviae]BBQ28440.1 hypothetical protein WP2W18E01_00220 [Aeromonas caviae]